MQDYLAATDVIDWQHEQVLALAQQLRRSATDDLSVAGAAFEWVRDNVQHSVDFNRCEVTCRASDVLAARTGFCYAKSHLLAALLRAGDIPAGFCYQRLSIDGDGPPFCLHGLNAVLLKEHGWYRVDARGNTQSLRADFAPPQEQLPFSAAAAGEADLPEIWPAPLPHVVAALTTARSVEELCGDLPDVPVIEA